MKIGIALGMISSSLLIAGCQTQPDTYVTPDGQIISSGGPPRNASDIALETNVRAEMSQYGQLSAVSPGVQVYSQNGTVTLGGSVPSERDRQMIDAMVRNTSGVAAVNDQLQVTYPPTSAEGLPPHVYATPPVPIVTPAPVVVSGQDLYARVQGTTPADQAIARTIVDRLQLDSVPASWMQNATITVSEGNASLQGMVDNQPEHQAIVSAVQRAPKVRAVYDQLQVR